jgi:alanine dehydrogenase
VLLLTPAETASLLELDALREAMGLAMIEVSAGRASMPTRIAALVPERGGLLAAMPAHLPGLGSLSAKLVSLFPGNVELGLPTHQAVILVFNAATGEPLALLDGTSITAARTAAGSALATDLCARRDASILTIIGTGVQARSHAQALSRVRSFTEIRIAGRDRTKAAALAGALGAELGGTAFAVGSVAAACRGADVVCATTHSPEPIVVRANLEPGVHVCSVGLNPDGREVDSPSVAQSVVFVESRAAALAPPPGGCNDLRIPIEEGLIGPDHLVEIGEVVAGARPGRSSFSDITLYKSVGIAAQDAAAADLVLRGARARGAGTEIAWL